MEDLQETIERINTVIQRIRQNQKQNGQGTSLQSQKSRQIQILKESSKVCPLCGGSGYIIRHNSKEQDTIKFCSCKDVDKSKILWRASGIETERNRLTFGNYKPYNSTTEKLKAVAIDYFKNFNNIRSSRRNSIAFLGQVGCGKTHLSVAIGLNLLSKGVPVVYMSYRDEILKLKQNILDEEYY